jgi:dihydrodipicolinate synthase/N-acetylneuraminate lyase
MTLPFKLRGILAPLTTPFAADGSLALDRLAANLAKYNLLPLTGYVLTGSTGESVMLTRDETDRVWSAARESAAPGKLLLAGAGVDSTAETISRVRRAAELGYDGALVKTPYYYKPMMTPAALEAHFRRVADASPIPIVIYSIPVFAGITVEADLAARLSEHPNIAGIKDSSGSAHRAGEIVRRARSGFQTVVGSAQTFAASLAAGAQGGVLALACVLPELCIELFEAHARGEASRVEDLQMVIAEPARTIVSKYGPPGVKYAMDRRGYFGGLPRSPFQPLNAEAAAEVDAILSPVSAPSVARGD